MNRCDVCGEMKEEWETHNFQGGLVRCKKHSKGFANYTEDKEEEKKQ